MDRGAESQNSWCEGLDTDSGYQESLSWLLDVEYMIPNAPRNQIIRANTLSKC